MNFVGCEKLGRMMRWLLVYLFMGYLLQHGLFFEPRDVCKTPNLPAASDIHFVTIIDSAVGTFLSTAHDFLFQQLYCGLNGARNGTRVRMETWHVDTELQTCEVFDSNDPVTNIHGKIYGDVIIPPSQTGSTVCKTLELAKRCASSIPLGQKVEIALPLLYHQEIGKCELDKILTFQDQKVVIFWTTDYYQRRSISYLSPNVEYIFFGSGADFLPQEAWKPNNEMVEALKNGKSESVKALTLRFQQMIGIKQKMVEKGFKRKRITTTKAPSKTATPKIVNAGIGFPFFKPKKLQLPSVTKALPPLPAIQVNQNPPLGHEMMPLIASGKSGDNSNLPKFGPFVSDAPILNDSMFTTLPPSSTTTTTVGFFDSFGELLGYPEHGLLFFILILAACIILTLLLLLCIWHCCCRKSTKGKYKVLEKESKPLSYEPDPEAGVAYGSPSSFEPFMAKPLVPRESIKAEKPTTENHVSSNEEEEEREPDVFATPKPAASPEETTPPLATPPASTPPPEPAQFSPAPLTVPSQVSQAADARSIKFNTERDDTRTIPELKALSDDNLWSHAAVN